MSFFRTERPADNRAPDSSEVMEGDVREFLRRDVASVSRYPEPGGEAVVGNLNSLVQRVAGSSVAELDALIAELMQLREHLHQEGLRVQYEIAAYTQKSQAAIRSTRIILESMGRLK
jgi:hypothetical protein